MTHNSQQRPEQSATADTQNGHWPAEAGLLPIFMSQQQVANLLGISIRTLERQRHEGTAIPFRKLGRRVLYARVDVLAALDARCYASTAEAKRAWR